MSSQVLYYRDYRAPFCSLGLAVDGTSRVVLIHFVAQGQEVISALKRLRPRAVWQEDAEKTAELARQLDEYFAGQRQRFELELAPEGSPFQQEVWRYLLQIPLGQTRSYGEVAKALGQPGAARAVGRANATNPIPIVIPCHRVIGSDGTLTGFGGGLPTKRELLRHEGVASQASLLADDL